MIAAYSVAAGVWPLGEVQYPLAAIASISAGAVSGVPASASTFAAASSALGFLSLTGLAASPSGSSSPWPPSGSSLRSVSSSWSPCCVSRSSFRPAARMSRRLAKDSQLPRVRDDIQPSLPGIPEISAGAAFRPRGACRSAEQRCRIPGRIVR